MAHAQHNPLAVALSFPPLHGIATPGVAVASPTTSSGPHLPLPPSPTREEQQSEYSWHHHRPAQQFLLTPSGCNRLPSRSMPSCSAKAISRARKLSTWRAREFCVSWSCQEIGESWYYGCRIVRKNQRMNC